MSESETSVKPGSHDLADEFAVALSVHERWKEEKELDISETFNGGDEFLRRCLSCAQKLVSWFDRYVDYPRLTDVWCYYLEDKAGDAFWELFNPGLPEELKDDDCLSLALLLRAPIDTRADKAPIDITWEIPGRSGYCFFRVVTRVFEDSEDAMPIFYSIRDAISGPQAPSFAFYGSLGTKTNWSLILETDTYDKMRMEVANVLGLAEYPEALPEHAPVVYGGTK